MDTLSITDLVLWTRIGVPEEERKTEQCVHISIDLFLNTKKAGEEDSVKESVDYEKLSKDVRVLGEQERKTIECLAEDIAKMILEKFSVSQVRITIKKYPLPEARHVSITITRP
jgi:7,8-dihydroneopterin aldolase/epimerase/oxygenase